MRYSKKGAIQYPDKAKPQQVHLISPDTVENMIVSALKSVTSLSDEQWRLLRQAQIALKAKGTYRRKNTQDAYEMLQQAMDRAEKHGGREMAITMFNWASLQIDRGKLNYWLDRIELKLEGGIL